MSTSSLEQAILKISKVMEDFVEKVQDSIEKLTNLDIARGKRKLPPQPHHNLQGTNAKRSRKVLKIDTLVGDCYDNSMDQPSIENHKVQDDKGLLEPFKASTSPGKRRETNSLGPNGKDANFVWDPGGIQHEVGVWSEDELNSSSSFWGMVLAKISVMVKTRQNRGEKTKTQPFSHNTSCCAKFRTTQPLCENAFVPISKKHALGPFSKSLVRISQECEPCANLVRIHFGTNFQSHALCLGIPQECEIHTSSLKVVFSS
ncbi:hypothetical protein CK203_055399 [Vitis vinifera]|uniref:Uncharacterized protein n=1 Tax=Vitis vinifera TaxID=29760 RepID=A0A438HMY9_VITVI|nr:hypothetical protein CK203_055399 [Vitis vinifera]